jgi:hypothetical protein
MASRPVEFTALLSKALARKAEAATNIATGAAGVTVVFATAPSGMHVDENGKLVPAADAREQWARRSGMEITSNEPPPPLPKPTLVTVRSEERAANEITFGGVDDDDGD